MPDMLVKLYELPPLEQELASLKKQGVELRRGLVPEKHVVSEWVRTHFNAHWASECEASYSRQPVSVFVAVAAESNQADSLLGFACYDAVMKGFFGPTGVHPDARGKGIGRALLLAALHGLKEEGYAYGIIGGAGPLDFYAKTVGAVAIDGSVPGIYRGMLR